jgi:hypothetical protein
MSGPVPMPGPRLNPARAASHVDRGGGPGLSCTVCGGPLDPRRREACSNRCRAALSRRRQAAALLARVDRLESLYQQAAEELKALRREVTGGRS